ncbi:unnamed protein product [Linum tenue]|uniref:Wound-responsive family protein n=1 Tax=Linum tenue TaxID=586396 RepID=A0AAV0R0Q5_9ROSI|nr:unnamed protein product [Linum tenue]
MSSTSKAWTVAASIGAVEALKDQLGFCRWNYILRSAHHYAKSNVRSQLKPRQLSSTSTSTSASQGIGGARKMVEQEKATRAEESLKTVMYLSCWGPYN